LKGLSLPILIDVGRTELQWRFFERYAAAEAQEEVLAAVASEELDTSAVTASQDCVAFGYAGWAYWLLYLRGFLEYQERGVLERDNVYARYFVDQYLPGPHDPGLRKELSDESSALARVSARFADFRGLIDHPQATTAAAALAPVRLLASCRRKDDLHDVHDAATGAVVKVRAVDGWHRLFAARLGGVPQLAGVVRLDEATWTRVT